MAQIEARREKSAFTSITFYTPGDKWGPCRAAGTNATGCPVRAPATSSFPIPLGRNSLLSAEAMTDAGGAPMFTVTASRFPRLTVCSYIARNRRLGSIQIVVRQRSRTSMRWIDKAVSPVAGSSA